MEQVLSEATELGISATDDPRDSEFEGGKRIAVTTVHRLFNGRSIFGVGAEGVKLRIGSVVVDDVHACVATINDQFRIRLKKSHPSYQAIFKIVESELKRQSLSRFLDLKAGDPRVTMEVPYWTWLGAQDEITEALHRHREDDELAFSYPLLSSVLSQSRCFFSGQVMEIEPYYPATDLVRAFSKAKRRIYMTATLADDSVLVTHFGAASENLAPPIVPTSSQSMGERMILMPQELNPDIEIEEVKALLQKFAKEENVVVIVPSKSAAKDWELVADQVLLGDDVVDGIKKLRKKRVGLTVLINRYDGIDLPDDACRVLVLVGLPEVTSFAELIDLAVLSESKGGLRRQMQRVEQGMGRGVRSNDDYCVVLLIGSKLIRRVKSSEGAALLTPATQAQLELSRKVAKQLENVKLSDIGGVIEQCLRRDPDWVKVSKKSLLRAATSKAELALDEKSIALRKAFDLSRVGDHKAAVELINSTVTMRRHGYFSDAQPFNTTSVRLSLKKRCWRHTGSIPMSPDLLRAPHIKNSRGTRMLRQLRYKTTISQVFLRPPSAFFTSISSLTTCTF